MEALEKKLEKLKPPLLLPGLQESSPDRLPLSEVGGGEWWGGGAVLLLLVLLHIPGPLHRQLDRGHHGGPQALTSSPARGK